jgi:hypothetical protein
MRISDLPPHLTSDQAFLALAGRPCPCFLDSAIDVHGLGHRSYRASNPFLVVHAKGQSTRLSRLRENREESWTGNPFDLLRKLLQEYRARGGRPGGMTRALQSAYRGAVARHVAEKPP